MQVREILKVKGDALHSAAPGTSAVEAVREMAERNLGSLVVFEDGRMVGLLTFKELLSAMAARGGRLDGLDVGTLMERSPVTASPEMEVDALRRVMLDSGARYLPVAEADGRVVGVLSFRDVARAVIEEQDFENRMLKGYIKDWPV